MAGDAFINSSTRAMSELSESLFVPAMIIGLVLEFPSFLAGKDGLDLVGPYLGYATAGFFISFIVIFLINCIGSENHIQYFAIGSGAKVMLGQPKKPNQTPRL